MSQYLILIYDEEAAFEALTPAELAAYMELHGTYPARVEALGGKVLGGNGLESVTTATTIRGEAVTDGPFAETKEVLGGYYLIEAPDRDVATAAGKACPTLSGGVEIRPVQVFS